MNSAVVNQFSSLLTQHGSQVFYQQVDVANAVATLSANPGAGVLSLDSMQHHFHVSYNQDYGFVTALFSPKYLEGAIKGIAFSADYGRTFYQLPYGMLDLSGADFLEGSVESEGQVERSVRMQVDNLFVRTVILTGGKPIRFSPVLGMDDFATFTVGLRSDVQATTFATIEKWLFSLAAERSRGEFINELRQLIPNLTKKEEKALISRYHARKNVHPQTQAVIYHVLARLEVEPSTEVKELIASQVPVSADDLALLSLLGRTPEDDAISTELAEKTRKALATLTPQDEQDLRVRFGVGEKQSLEEAGVDFNVTRARIRQIEALALRKLRESSLAKALRSITEDDSDDEGKKPE